MAMSKIATLAGVLASAGLVAGHGYVTQMVIDGETYGGWLADSYYYQDSPPDNYGWSTTVTDNGFVAPDAFSSDDIICHKGATPGALSAPVTAGSSIDVTWNTWPDSHKGPIINYIAKCDGDCASADKTTLEWVKIQADAIVDASTDTWITDELIANDFTTSVTIPSSIADGNYVLRHEIIALHSAGSEGGAQAYPQCLNIVVSGGGSANPTGTLGTELYTSTDDGIIFDIYSSASSYPMPGPELFSA
ncbi:lytic polysaccharide monooxygenase auxiliary activity family 9 protein [Aspergillus stella-maris]|uniref:lytic polysaccharide monooxygenase auxiliary activity family 9 protein n=1 Tax=Aspergillus stella-maris TaxID=1810926 RepID=UPI003CCD2A6A